MPGRLIDKYLTEPWRRTVRNWPSEINAIVDGYRSYTTIPHAVQKDAIQNSWSARKDKKGKEWNFTFELLEAKGMRFLLMTDCGTTGLTGRVLTPEEYEKDLPAEERWGRFEGVAFTQPRSERTLGSRGRGKFIFVGASKEYTILYDTLRDDGLYRFGFRTVERTESPIYAADGENGKQKLREISGNLIEPLSTIGTRVIIVNPVDEIVSAVKKGLFVRHIGETWWEIILKYNVAIQVKFDGKEQTATIPAEFDLKSEDAQKSKTWISKNQKISVGYRDVKIKNFHIVYSGGEPVPEDIRGVAIQRDGMKICTIEPKYISKEIGERLYGYINFDSDTEEDLLSDEGIEHYSYDFRRTTPGAVRRYVEDEIMRFAQQKLGFGVDAREIQRQQQRNAERRALLAANAFAHKIGIGSGPGRRGTHGGTTAEREIKKTRIKMEELLLPRSNDLRVNYGESVKNIKIKIINDDGRGIDLRLKIFLRFYDKTIKTFFEQDISVKPHLETDEFGPFEEEFAEDNYPDAGKYTVVSKIVSLMDEDKGTEFDYKTKIFYLNEEPPTKGLFERCEANGFPDEEPIKFWMGYGEYGSERGLVLYYNVKHPSYTSVAGNEEDLTEYILRIMAPEICRYDLMYEDPIIFKSSQRDDPQEILKSEQKVIGELIYKFRKGEI